MKRTRIYKCERTANENNRMDDYIVRAVYCLCGAQMKNFARVCLCVCLCIEHAVQIILANENMHEHTQVHGES